jgi:hypothetical protein
MIECASWPRKQTQSRSQFIHISARWASDGAGASINRYAFAVLDALAFRWGPAHIEVKRTPAGPILVEINAGRWNGVNFKLLADICVGHNAIDATLDAFLSPRAWGALPRTPPPELRGCARYVKLVSSCEGRLSERAAALFESLPSELPSLLRLQTDAARPGERVDLTVDLASSAGFAHLVHQDAAVLERDYERLRQLQRDGSLFEVE